MKRSKRRSDRINYAIINVVFSDGCRKKLETRPDAAIASDPVKFAHWLAQVAEETLEAATTQGMCAPKSSTHD